MRTERETHGRSLLVVKARGVLQRCMATSQKGMLYLAGPHCGAGTRKAGGPGQRSRNYQKVHGPSLADSLPQIRPVNALVSGTDWQGKEYAGGEQSPKDVAVNAQIHIKRKENKPSLHITDTLGKVHKRTELPGSSGAHHSSFE